MADGLKGWKRLWRATVVSYWGLGYALRNEEAFRIEFALCVLLAPLALWLGHNKVERIIMLMSLFVVLITELLNSGIEVAIDRISKEQHPLSGAAKDLGSAAVHLSLLQVPLVWSLVLFT
ncbi:MAG TPA: diacylglycerol kinase [Nevskiaceae bacterium]|nr:diacylglycerol kinase [Nevskiaceae bacterium]